MQRSAVLRLTKFFRSVLLGHSELYGNDKQLARVLTGGVGLDDEEWSEFLDWVEQYG